MLLSNLEYVPLRLLRRFVFRKRILEACGRLIPYYPTNMGEVSPQTIVSTYSSYLQARNISLDGKVILELGAGATNGTGYELVAAGAARVFCLEPFARFKIAVDQSILSDVRKRHGVKVAEIVGRTHRVASFDAIPPHSVHLVVSSSVLEHVADLGTLCDQLERVLAPGGQMLHLVDYRDHFFKYPYHFLQFSQSIWNAFLNPGDLPRWRLSDHLSAFARASFETSVLEERSDSDEFVRIAPHISTEFDRSNSLLAVTFAAILANRRSPD